MKATMLFLPLLLAITTSCTPGKFSSDSIPSSTVDKTKLLELLNKARQTGCKCGDTYYDAAPALTWNNLLESASYKHAKDMFQNKYFSHIAPDGSNAAERIEREGYTWLTYGENIGSGYKNEQEVVEGWLESPSHCKNIMNKQFKEIGTARVGNIWTQEFATRK